MGKDTHKFSNTEIHILERGLGWIKESEDDFTDRLFHRLLRDHPEVTTSLHSTGLQPFSRHIVQVIQTIIDDLRSCGTIRSPIRELWADLSPTTVSPFGPEQFGKIAETYLDILSELAEDAWSPAMELAWRKAIDEVSIQLWGRHSEFLSISKMLLPFQFIKRRKHDMSHTLFFFMGTIIILAGGIASLGLWSRCRLAEVKLQRKPSLKNVWCN